MPDIETRVRTAIAALEQAGYLERGNNMPHVYATGITVRNMDEARQRITDSVLFDNEDREKAFRIIKSLISQKHIAKAQDAEAESRVDYLADILGLSRGEVVSAVVRMRQEGILADCKDITAYLHEGGVSEHKAQSLLQQFARLEQYILRHIPDGGLTISCKQLNDDAVNSGVTTSTEKSIRTLLYFLTVKGYIRKQEDPARNIRMVLQSDMDTTQCRSDRRLEICRFALEWLYAKPTLSDSADAQSRMVQFSIVDLFTQAKSAPHSLFGSPGHIQVEDVEEALLYLSNIGALKLDGGFMVLYNAMAIHRLKDMKLRYKQEDYRLLDEFYRQKIQQVHIVGEYANLMVRNYQAAQQYVHDYFQMEYKRFVAKYFKGGRADEIQRNITPRKYQKLFAELSDRQKEIVSDKESRCIVVAAGPGSGKTRVLVHKLASLLLLEDVKHEQLLMLTFSRAAATEFKQRLMGLIGESAHYVEIKTFHSYSFDLLGRIGNLDDAKDVVARAAAMVNRGEVEPNKMCKTVLVIDEAQDMSAEEYALVRALMAHNENMRVIAVGDDDQNIFEFRGSDSQYLYQLSRDPDSRFIEMTQNYRSTQHVIAFANSFAGFISSRMKSTPIVPVRREEGRVEVTRHWSTYMYQPLVDNLLARRGDGTSCILTQTNEEAVVIIALLRRHGVQCTLIQSMDGFRFSNLAEVKYLLNYIARRATTPLIPGDLWEEAKRATFAFYDSSLCLPCVERSLRLFEQTNRAKYLTDLREFLSESSVEDFFAEPSFPSDGCPEGSTGEVVVSTIHKAKGREFDDVYMLLSDRPNKDAGLFRQYYVGMTRARNRLFIHTNGDLFLALKADSTLVDSTPYPLPDEIMLQLSHKDVFLSFFKPIKKDILALRSGDTLLFEDNLFLVPATRKPVAKLSAAMQSTILSWQKRGYSPSTSTVRFVVAWKPKDAPKEEPETAVLLIDLLLRKT